MGEEQEGVLCKRGIDTDNITRENCNFFRNGPLFPDSKSAVFGIMRFPELMMFALLAYSEASAQCPVRPQQVAVNSAGNIVIGYENSGTRTVRAVQFNLVTANPSNGQRALIATYNVAETLRPQRSAGATFKSAGQPKNIYSDADGSMVLMVSKVQFSDLTTWTPALTDVCEVSFPSR